MSDEESFDPSFIVDALAELVLGEKPNLTRADVARLSGLSPEVTRARWRALGFPEVGDDDVAFTQADVEALGMAQQLIDLGVINDDTEQAFIRTIGRTFSRLAEWEVRAMLVALFADAGDPDVAADRIGLLEDLIPLGERIQTYAWRRHLVGAASRLALTDMQVDVAEDTCIGFADIVGYTTRSRRMTARELAELVERFESVVAGLITDHHGRVIKSIGDEILFATDDVRDAAELALDLLEQHEQDKTFPQIRVGMSYGRVMNRLGDVYGPVVNLASRLTNVARPGHAVIDHDMAAQLKDDEAFRLRRMRRTSVKGFELQEMWSLKRPR